MSKITEEFLTAPEEQEVIHAIKIAELNTSGEIRVHIEETANGDVDSRATEVFSILKMNETKLRNGVLLYVAVADKTFAIYGDKGINELVANSFWDDTRNIILSQFKKGQFKQGLVDGILHAGEQLQIHFPWDASNENELTNSISKG